MRVNINLDEYQVGLTNLLQSLHFTEDEIVLFGEKYITLYNALFLEHVLAYLDLSSQQRVKAALSSQSNDALAIQQEIEAIYASASRKGAPSIETISDSAKILTSQIILGELDKSLDTVGKNVLESYIRQISEKVVSGLQIN